jgi:hypothetical protein
MDNFSTYNSIIKECLSLAIYRFMKMLQEKELTNYCFYITFDKNFENNIFPTNVNSEQLVTIVLENQFWDLDVDDDGFSVSLEINGQNEEIYVDFDSIILFHDHSSNFILDFRPIYQENSIDFLKDSDEILLVELP